MMMVYLPRSGADALTGVSDNCGSYTASVYRPGQSSPGKSGESLTLFRYSLTNGDLAETLEGDGEESGRGELWQDHRDEPGLVKMGLNSLDLDRRIIGLRWHNGCKAAKGYGEA